MSGIGDTLIIRAISQISCTFCCEIGNPDITIFGTGFFIINNKKNLMFVTNKHNLDPTLKLGSNTTYKLAKISLCLRKKTQLTSAVSLETNLFDLISYEIKHAEKADVSVLYEMKINNIAEMEKYQPESFSYEELAHEEYFLDKISMMDQASFVGFPGRRSKPWWDENGKFPIARSGIIASLPKKSFQNKSIQTDETILFSGLSFSGSSGSPLFLHQKGIKIMGAGNISIKNDHYIAPKIIGIMSGHWWDDDNEPEMFKHSGLSYFTKSTAILNIIYDL